MCFCQLTKWFTKKLEEIQCCNKHKICHIVSSQFDGWHGWLFFFFLWYIMRSYQKEFDRMKNSFLVLTSADFVLVIWISKIKSSVNGKCFLFFTLLFFICHFCVILLGDQFFGVFFPSLYLLSQYTDVGAWLYKRNEVICNYFF